MSRLANPGPNFQLTLVPSGRHFEAAPEESILSAGIRQGVNLPYGCKDGACGSCKCKKISGTVHHGAHQSKALTDDEESQGWVLTCCATAQSDVVLESRQVGMESAFPIKKMPTRVISLQKMSHDVMCVKLQLPAQEPLKYHAGQYIDFLLPHGLRRSYSMAIAPHHVGTGLELHIRHMPGGLFTDQVFGSMKERDILRIEGPFGSFYLREDSNKPIILLASGTGFAPIKALIEQLELKCSVRPITLYWGGRRPSDLYLDDWVKGKLETLSALRYVPVVSDALPDDGWTGRTGFVHRAVLQDHASLANFQVYACGAPVVVDSARRDYLQAGLPEDEFFADAFTSEADKATAGTLN
ncbi:MAG: CDP-6-deoxy-delta-3,4-glucoseen reductase [Rhodoferax sp.]|nr:CDP-6-deoxy-delta-3,4-glucoseen reductase [Rhodoferax sp.]